MMPPRNIVLYFSMAFMPICAIAAIAMYLQTGMHSNYYKILVLLTAFGIIPFVAGQIILAFRYADSYSKFGAWIRKNMAIIVFIVFPAIVLLFSFIGNKIKS